MSSLLSTTLAEMKMAMMLCAICALLTSICVTQTQAENEGGNPQLPQGHNPQVCLNYYPALKKWGFDAYWFTDGQPCPDHNAYYGTADPAGKEYSAAATRIFGDCCPLPAKDILTEEHTWNGEECPENYVATGNKFRRECSECTSYMRCTKINTSRYQLGPSRPSIYWGVGATSLHVRKPLGKRDIPAAIRYGIGRTSKGQWGPDGCIGDPPGSLLVKKTSKLCSGFFFRELQFSGAKGDPPAGTPVKMFPECRRLANVLDPQARCVE